LSVVGSISIKDNASAVLRSIHNEQISFRKDVAKTKSELKATWDKKYQAKLDSTAAAKQAQQLKTKLEPLRKKVVTAVAIKDMATDKVKNVAKQVKKVGGMVAKPVVNVVVKGAQALSKIGGAIAKTAKVAAVGAAAVSVGVSAIVGSALSSGAALEQNIGGIETLFKDNSGVVKANADKAFKTAGLSANAYMETVTGFSASLLQSLGGDTVKAAEMADMAIIDMADNSNKMGTSMESIQNAYAGFAKQNYTMLDNLKLGYGGTKEEMQRLLKDAQKISGVKYDIKNLADVYSAIHVIQKELDITGTTEKEASETFSGSLAAMKSAVSNLMGNLAIGGDVETAMGQVVDSAATFLFGNAIPMVGSVLKALPKAIGSGIKKVVPKIKKEAPVIVKSLKEGLMESFPSLAPIIGQGFDTAVSGMKNAASVVRTIADGFAPLLPQLAAFGTGMSNMIQSVTAACLPALTNIISTVQTMLPVILPVIGTVVSSIGNIIAQASPVIAGLVAGIGTVVSTLAPIFSTIFSEIGEKVGTVISFVGERMGFIQDVIGTVAPVIGDVISTVWGVVSPVIDIAINVFKILFGVVQKVFPGIQSVIETVWDAIKPIVEGIGKVVGKIAGWFGNVADAISGAGDLGTDVGTNAEGDNNWKGGLTWVGEKGAELVDLPRGSRILPHKESLSISSGLAGAKNTVTSVVQKVVAGRNPDDGSGNILRDILDLVQEIVERIRGTQGTGTTDPDKESATVYSRGRSISINIKKLADEIIVRKDEDIDELADRVAKKVLEVVLNMG